MKYQTADSKQTDRRVCLVGCYLNEGGLADYGTIKSFYHDNNVRNLKIFGYTSIYDLKNHLTVL